MNCISTSKHSIFVAHIQFHQFIDHNELIRDSHHQIIKNYYILIFKSFKMHFRPSRAAAIISYLIDHILERLARTALRRIAITILKHKQRADYTFIDNDNIRAILHIGTVNFADGLPSKVALFAPMGDAMTSQFATAAALGRRLARACDVESL